MIEFDRISKTYAGRTGEPVHAVREVTLEVARGETVCLVGKSGSGKTTLLRLVNRMVEPSSGRTLVDGRDVSQEDAVALRRRTGYVVQRGGLLPHRTVTGNIGLLGELSGWPRERIAARVDELLELVQLAPSRFRERYHRELSGGQRQRVGVARALFLDPAVLLMDEPFGALDPLTRTEVQDAFLGLASGDRTTLLVTHDLDEAFRLGDRVALLEDGRLLALGSPDELRVSNDASVRRFLGREASYAG